jgi:hypothetical protein
MPEPNHDVSSEYKHGLLPCYTGAIPIGTPEEMAAAMSSHADFEWEMNIRNGYINPDTLSVEQIASLDEKYPGWEVEARERVLVRAEEKLESKSVSFDPNRKAEIEACIQKLKTKVINAIKRTNAVNPETLRSDYFLKQICKKYALGKKF